ncbi:MAG TPA: D-alanyl-D-alanine carboxypeptidase family protein [Gaiellaceae bacterium]|jgi:D-alanyl-D-alanine carboxypeptidase|nr:D-alanyl-D-alanine carboxypeptidase family protein [Gaiellaceae bacterium]
MRALVVAVAALVLAAPASSAAPPFVDASAYLVENGATGEVLVGHRANARVPIASITKLMTVLVALDHARPDDVVVASPFAASVGESTINLRAGERIPVRDLVEAALVQSANDAAWALAADIGKGDVSRFVALMNRKAKAIGLRDTHFVRPDGLDVAGHVSTARDVSLLARVAMRNPLIRSIVDDRTATITGGRRLHTWNDLLAMLPGTIGVKTGHTAAAGWSQVAAVNAPGFVLYATVLGSPTRASRNADLVELVRWGLSLYTVAELVTPGRVYARADVGYGRKPVALVAGRKIMRSVRVDRDYREVVVAPTSLPLPVTKGARYGTVRVYDGVRLVATAPLVAARSETRPGVVSRAWRAVRGLWP